MLENSEIVCMSILDVKYNRIQKPEKGYENPSHHTILCFPGPPSNSLPSAGFSVFYGFLGQPADIEMQNKGKITQKYIDCEN